MRVLVVVAVLAAALPAPAQTLDRGEGHGTGRDETGGVLEGVSVTLRETRTSFERAVTTGRDGQYSAPMLPLGVYVVQADRSGFARTVSEPVTLMVGQALVVNIAMRLEGIAQTVSVS